MRNPHTVLAAPQSVRSHRLPTEREILELAEMTSYMFDSPNAVGLKERLQEQAEAYRDWLRHQQRLQDDADHASLGTDKRGHRRVAYGLGAQRTFPDHESLTFLLALFFTCPQMLSQPAGFEWVLQDLVQVLFARRLDPESDQIFEKAMNTARIRSRVGPPKDKALEYFRYQTITELMYPSVVIPGVKAKKLNKTKAVEFVAGMETRLVNGEGGTRSIWTAHKRVDQFLRQLTERVQAKPVTVSPPTKTRDREPRERVRKTEKGIQRTKHRKPPRHT
jgi:hypothetical protein